MVKLVETVTPEGRKVYGQPSDSNFSLPQQYAALPPKLPIHAKRFIDRLTSEQRKQFPMAAGLLDYAPDALAAVSHISWVGNEKHNKGEPLHHARGKSMDHADCIIRHLSTRDLPDPVYADDVCAEVFHLAEAAWRCLMLLQEKMEQTYGLDIAPGAK